MRGAKMKFIALLSVLCTLSGIATAQTSQCQSIAKNRDRLACYDKISPPMAKPAAFKTTAEPSKTAVDEQGPMVDRLAVENARLDAKINNICRGC